MTEARAGGSLTDFPVFRFMRSLSERGWVVNYRTLGPP